MCPLFFLVKGSRQGDSLVQRRGAATGGGLAPEPDHRCHDPAPPHATEGSMRDFLRSVRRFRRRWRFDGRGGIRLIGGERVRTGLPFGVICQPNSVAL